MGKAFDVVVALDSCVDLLVSGGDLVPEFGQKEKLVDGYSVAMGGSSCIFACQCAKLGLKTVGVGAVGDDDFGLIVRSALMKAGVDISRLRTEPDVQTGLGIALCTKGDRAILTHLGTIDSATAHDLPDDLIGATRHLHVGSYCLMNRLRSAYPRILREAKRSGATASLDPNWDPAERWDGVTELLPFVDIFLPNENEARAIAGEDDIDRAEEKLGRLVPILALKQGRAGATLRSTGGKAHSPSREYDVVDTVGAGDSFDAGFVYGFLANLPLEECLRIGCICGSMTVREAGGSAGQVDEAELRTLLGNDGAAGSGK